MNTPKPDKRLTVMFLTTSMPVGGAETLLVNLVHGIDETLFAPEVICLKEPGPLGEVLAQEFPVHANLLTNKFDFRILPRLWKLMRDRQADVVVTVGAGDKMFWGRLAAKLANVPVIISALHSTGWPDSIGRLNRLLTPLTDAFIGVADAHAEHLVQHERFPQDKVHAIYNGVDTDRFTPGDKKAIRQELGIPTDAAVVGILAALRPEKNHELFLHGAKQIAATVPSAQFVVIGDGPRRADLEQLTCDLGIADIVHFLGSRSDVPEVLRSLDLLALTSHNEASPVSILEALSSGIPVVASEVGSVPETVIPNETGLLFPPGDTKAFASAAIKLLQDKPLLTQLGAEGRQRVIQHWSLQAMVAGYQSLIQRLYNQNPSNSTQPDRHAVPGTPTASSTAPINT
ncbi:MAG: glycosyltransferase [Planctomycetes bacterium]|nr:glycosyltransferase [Planctomycetota bacterium]